MRRPIATVLLLSVIAARPALGAERGPVCREPSVVDEIAREVQAGNYYDHVDAKLVTEQPTADPHVVRCQVCVQSAPYDATRFGDRPVAQCKRRDFEVRIMAGGFVVSDQQ